MTMTICAYIMKNNVKSWSKVLMLTDKQINGHGDEVKKKKITSQISNESKTS